MKKLIAVLALLVGLSANASIINIEISDTNVSVGETVSVSLLATNFEDFDTTLTLILQCLTMTHLR